MAYRQGYVELAWSLLREAPREIWTRHAAAEYARSGLAEAPGEALAEIRRLAAEDPPELRAKFWYDVLGPVFGMGASEEARAVFAIFDRHVSEDDQVWPAAAKHRDWMREWVAADPDSPTAPATGRRTFAVLDYGHPSATRASANIGDHVQSIAALGHLVRHDNVRLHGDEQLVGLLERLRERTRPERRRHDVEADLEVITAHRDASIYQAIPEDTWTLAFGWYMHPLFNFRHAFPLHRNLRPIFVSFHCNKRSLLTPEAVEYLKRYGPVGCRDWTTVYLLLSLGVPAFFSGCLTTTIDAVFPDLEGGPPAGAPIGYVDAPRTRSRRAPSPIATAARRCGSARSWTTRGTRSSCSTPTAAATARSSRRVCTATCRCGRSASTSTSCPPTAPTSASTGSPASTTGRSARCGAASTTGSAA